MKALSFISENKKRISITLLLIGVLILISFIIDNKKEKVQTEPPKDLLQIVDDFSNTIENKEDTEKILKNVEDFSKTATTSQDTVDILTRVDSFSDSIKGNK